jgi:SAM-dependent methyltransferase
MKRFSRPNINTAEYWDRQYADRCDVNFEHTLRQNTYLWLVDGCRNVVELGCGLSPFCVLASKTMSATGLDLSERAIRFLKSMYPLVSWHVGDAVFTPFPDASFDAVVSGELIEHLEDPTRLLLEMERLCRPGGRMVLSTPRLEFEDPEHLWEFEPIDFVARGFAAGVVESQMFPGRSYIFAWKDKA